MGVPLCGIELLELLAQARETLRRGHRRQASRLSPLKPAQARTAWFVSVVSGSFFTVREHIVWWDRLAARG